MERGKRRSLRSQAEAVGGYPHDGAIPLLRGASETSSVDDNAVPSLSSRSESMSPTPTLGTETVSAAPSPTQGGGAAQPRLRRPMNSFLLFSNEHRPKIAMANPELTNAAVSVLLGEQWKALPLAERAVYVEAAKKIKEDFKLEHPEYRYARTTRTKGKKRKQELEAQLLFGVPPPGGVKREPASLSLHALALAGATLASPAEPAPPRGFFPPVGGVARGHCVSPCLTTTTAASTSDQLERPVSRSSSLSMLDQLCVVADGVQRVRSGHSQR